MCSSDLQSPAVGSFFELVLSTWFPAYSGFHSLPVLVAHYGSRHPGLRSYLCGVQSEQDTTAGALWSSATSHTSSPMVPCFPGLRHRPSSLWRQHLCPFHSAAPQPKRLQRSWYSMFCGYTVSRLTWCLIVGLLPVLAGLLYPHRGHR